MMQPELTALAVSALLQLGQILLAAWSMNRDVGVAYNASPRDTPAEFSVLTGRLRRAVGNHFEAMALFTIAVVVVTLSGSAGRLTAACAGSISPHAFSTFPLTPSAGLPGDPRSMLSAPWPPC
jgi:uncharacterized MAPEG superfamily protein